MKSVIQIQITAPKQDIIDIKETLLKKGYILDHETEMNNTVNNKIKHQRIKLRKE